MKKPVKSDEVAQDEIDFFCDFYDLEENDLSDDALKKTVEKIKKGIRLGSIEIKEAEDGSLQVSQVLRNGETLIYPEISGEHKVAMKGAGQEDLHGKIYALVGAMTGKGAPVIRKLKGSDLSYAECIGSLFLNV